MELGEFWKVLNQMLTFPYNLVMWVRYQNKPAKLPFIQNEHQRFTNDSVTCTRRYCQLLSLWSYSSVSWFFNFFWSGEFHLALLYFVRYQTVIHVDIIIVQFFLLLFSAAEHWRAYSEKSWIFSLLRRYDSDGTGVCN